MPLYRDSDSDTVAEAERPISGKQCPCPRDSVVNSALQEQVCVICRAMDLHKRNLASQFRVAWLFRLLTFGLVADLSFQCIKQFPLALFFM